MTEYNLIIFVSAILANYQLYCHRLYSRVTGTTGVNRNNEGTKHSVVRRSESFPGTDRKFLKSVNERYSHRSVHRVELSYAFETESR